MRGRPWGTILLIFVALLLFLWLIKAPILSSYLSHKLGIRISAGTISVWPSSMKIKKFFIRNPKGFDVSHALKVALVDVRYQWEELKSDPSVINSITMNDLDLDVEIKDQVGQSNNWSVIIEKMSKTNRSSKRVVIRKLILKNLKVHVSGGPFSSPETRTFDLMEFENIDSKEGFPTEELIEKIFGKAGILKYIERVLPGGQVLKILPFGTKKEAKGTSPLASQTEKS